eukprot:m.57403 g.57403  ORF g.57403 m.57403 type:complete len:277 (+) comp12108_c0_seq2:2361-3191(+)
MAAVEGNSGLGLCTVALNLQDINGENENTLAVFVDLDGTLCPTDMHHVVFYFIYGLPSTRQRWLKLALFFPYLGFIVGPACLLGEGATIKLLAWLALSSVSEADAEVASQEVTRRLTQLARPQLLAELKSHQEHGRPIAIITGNLQPLVAHFCSSINAACLSSRSLVKNGYHTGFLAGGPLIGPLKSELLHGIFESQPGTLLSGVYGYGNSKNDKAFLSVVEHARAVTPDSKLERHATEQGWPSHHHEVEESDHGQQLGGTARLIFVAVLFVLSCR